MEQLPINGDNDTGYLFLRPLLFVPAMFCLVTINRIEQEIMQYVLAISLISDQKRTAIAV